MARIAVLLGGLSPERPVSLVSGEACAAALARLGHEVLHVDPAEPGWIAALAAAAPAAVFNSLHGAWGEDGRIQGVLDYLQLPYTHSGVLASALAMDKDKAKAVFAFHGLDVPKGRVMDRREAAAAHPMALPYVVKPNAEGSSFGVFIVREGANRPPAQLLDPDWRSGDAVLVEEFIRGRELTVAVLGDRPLAVTEIRTEREFYDYDAKYAAGGSFHVVDPADLAPAVAEQAKAQALLAHQCLGCRGLTRSDFRYDPASGRLVLLEINTQPGMTPTSLAPEQAAHVGLGFDDLIAWMLEDAAWPR